MDPQRSRLYYYDHVQVAEIQRQASYQLDQINKMNPDRNWGLGICKVMLVDYEELFVTLRVQVGASDNFLRLPVPITFPGMGMRHFLGAMPEVGDWAVVGWIPQESSRAEGTRIPMILTWFPAGVWPARDWAVTQGFSPDEFDQGLERNADVVAGVHQRFRRKLRHMQPGNIVASSSQGSDLVLDEGVVITNRRGNEIRLRDQDQALITRSLQHFHAGAGTRTYSGMVQRDAQLLQTQMVSDGLVWDGGNQSVYEEPIPDTDLEADPVLKRGFLAPTARVLRKKLNEDGTLSRAVLPLNADLDPYQFLQRGGFIDSKGNVVDARHRPDAVYGGKPMFRVAAQSSSNAVLESDRDTLTEYRVEVTHTSKGRLPVTEQTDMFDADRLPPGVPGHEQSSGYPPNAPFIEWVMGSVVGNDPFSRIGRPQYGLPLVLTVFDGDKPNPRVATAKLVTNQETGESPTPIQEHAATLFRVRPPLDANIPETFWSVNKKAQLRAAVGGPANENSVEVALAGGLKLSVGGELGFLFNNGVRLGSQAGAANNNVGVDLNGGSGAVRIQGGGPITDGERGEQRQAGKEDQTPSVLVKSDGSTRIEASKKTEILSETAEVTAATASVTGQQAVVLQSPQAVQMSAETLIASSSGKTAETFSGPKDQKTSNGPLHERTYSPSVTGAVCEEVTYEQGDRVETFTQGNHETTVKVGDLSYKTESGTYKAASGSNTLTLDSDGFTGQAKSGSMTLKATAGSATFSGSTGVTISSSEGFVTLEALVVELKGDFNTAPDQGAAIVSGSLEPLTGLPYDTWGMGAQSVQVGER
jgi:hypothetical protein